MNSAQGFSFAFAFQGTSSIVGGMGEGHLYLPTGYVFLCISGDLGVLEGHKTLYLVSLVTGFHIVLLLIYFGFRLFTVAPYLFKGESLQGLFHPSVMSFILAFARVLYLC